MSESRRFCVNFIYTVKYQLCWEFQPWTWTQCLKDLDIEPLRNKILNKLFKPDCKNEILKLYTLSFRFLRYYKDNCFTVLGITVLLSWILRNK